MCVTRPAVCKGDGAEGHQVDSRVRRRETSNNVYSSIYVRTILRVEKLNYFNSTANIRYYLCAYR